MIPSSEKGTERHLMTLLTAKDSSMQIILSLMTSHEGDHGLTSLIQNTNPGLPEKPQECVVIKLAYQLHRGRAITEVRISRCEIKFDRIDLKKTLVLEGQSQKI